MTRIAIPALLGTLSALGAEITSQAIEQHSVGATSAVTICGVVAGAAWWMASQNKSTQYELSALRAELVEMRKAMLDLPCKGTRDTTCILTPKPKKKK